MHISEHRFPAPEASPRPQRPNDMRSHLTAHRGWKDRVGAALIGAASLLGAEGCATTASQSGSLYDNPSRNAIRVYTDAETRAEQEARDAVARNISVQRIEAQAQNAMRNAADNHDVAGFYREMREEAGLLLIRDELRRQERPNGGVAISLSDVQAITATLLRRINQNIINEARSFPTATGESLRGNTLSGSAAYRILHEISACNSLGTLADPYHFRENSTHPNSDYARLNVQALFNYRISNDEAFIVDRYATADFVRAYAHALRVQEERAVARSYERSRNATQGRLSDDLPSGITFENQRPTPPPTPPTLRLTQNPYGDETNSQPHHRHHRRHRP